MADSSSAPVDAAAAVDEPPDDESPSFPWPPAVSARYDRLEKIGAGMFSEVYKARDLARGGKAVAVKHLRGRGDARFLKTGLHELAREAMSLYAVSGHPAVVSVVATHADASRPDGDCFLVMEYAGRRNLRDYLLRRRRGKGRRRPFGEGEVRGAMAQMLAGLRWAHDEAGVLHRDVEPESVVVWERSRLRGLGGGGAVTYKLCGFGLSEPADRAEKDGLATLASSAAYRAPELLLGSSRYDGRVDTWGLGCVMAELLAGTGEPLFAGVLAAGETAASQLRQVLDVVGARGVKAWLGLAEVERGGCRGGTEEAARAVRACPDEGRLREMFPEKVLSQDGFDVLSGLLESGPGERLTAAAALEMPWFTKPRCGGCFRVTI
ncbi:hypothetical protein EJB05_50654, partial [Eragrostis curvula]